MFDSLHALNSGPIAWADGLLALAIVAVAAVGHFVWYMRKGHAQP